MISTRNSLMPTDLISKLAKAVDSHLKKVGVRSPGTNTLSRLFEIVHFTSLKTEEARPLQLRIVWVDPQNSDPGRPPHPRPDRWKITKLSNPLPFTVANLVKLAKAADPWSSALAVFNDGQGKFLVWGLVDQTVHFNTMLVRESKSGYAPPGLFQVVATGTADLTVYREHSFVARLAQDVLLGRQSDVFWSGPVSDCLDTGIQTYLTAVSRKSGSLLPKGLGYWGPLLADEWISTLCRLLISIQRYRHGGALLLTRSHCDLDIRYQIRYRRLPRALVNLGVNTIRNASTRERVETEYLDQYEDFIPTDLYFDEVISEGDADDFRDEITGAVRFISSLSCVDGLILAGPGLTIRGFGVEIRTKEDPHSVFISSEPKAREKTLRQIDAHNYGTRHRSMMRYCFAHAASLGFVISHDGEIRSMTRVGDRLIMWENLKVLDTVEPVRLGRTRQERPNMAKSAMKDAPDKGDSVPHSIDPL
jgi:hypothetical protein